MAAPVLSKPEAIITAVDAMERNFSMRQDRQDEDYEKWWRGREFNVNTDVDRNEIGTDFRSFTANESQTFARKVIAVLASAKVLFQVNYGQAQQTQRQQYDLKEQFLNGAFSMADESFMLRTEPTMQEQLSFLIPIRGWGAVLAHLSNQPDQTSRIDIRVWDPRYTLWKMGPGGLQWACYKTTRTASDVKAEYDVQMRDHEDVDLVDVYEFWDRTHNTVVMEGKTLKKRTRHGGNRVPVALAPVGPAPRVWNETVELTESDYGESIFATNRIIYDLMNEVWSYWLELTARSANANYVYKSDLEDQEFEESPGGESGVVTQIGLGEALDPLPLPETARDSAALAQQVVGMVQRGALPYTSFGEIQFQISGYAITQLNQQIMTVLGPQFAAMKAIYFQVSNLLTDQFNSGAFYPISLRGQGNDRDYFQFDFQPGMFQDTPAPAVTVVAELPQDDVTSMSLAQQARSDPTGQGPLLPDRFIWERYLKLPDTALIARMVKEQQAERANPAALSFSLMQAALEQGNQELAQIHQLSLKSFLLQQQLQLAQLQQVGQQIGGPAGQPGVSGAVSPAIAQTGQPNGAPQPPQQLTPGTPRPSRQFVQ